MKCEQCAADGRDVNMEALGGGQFQCPDCRFCVVPSATQAPAVTAPEIPARTPTLAPLPDLKLDESDEPVKE